MTGQPDVRPRREPSFKNSSLRVNLRNDLLLIRRRRNISRHFANIVLCRVRLSPFIDLQTVVHYLPRESQPALGTSSSVSLVFLLD